MRKIHIAKHLPGLHDQASHAGKVTGTTADEDNVAFVRAEKLMQLFSNPRALEKIGFTAIDKSRKGNKDKFEEIEKTAKSLFQGAGGAKVSNNTKYRWNFFRYVDGAINGAGWLLDMGTGTEYLLQAYEQIHSATRGSQGNDYSVKWIKQNKVAKHLPGQHDQQEHGRKLENTYQPANSSSQYNVETAKTLLDDFGQKHGFINGAKIVMAPNGTAVAFKLKSAAPMFSMYNSMHPRAQYSLSMKVGKKTFDAWAYETKPGQWQFESNPTRRWGGEKSTPEALAAKVEQVGQLVGKHMPGVHDRQMEKSSAIEDFLETTDYIDGPIVWTDAETDDDPDDAVEKAGTSAGAFLAWQKRHAEQTATQRQRIAQHSQRSIQQMLARVNQKWNRRDQAKQLAYQTKQKTRATNRARAAQKQQAGKQFSWQKQRERLALQYQQALQARNSITMAKINRRIAAGDALHKALISLEET